MHCSIPAGVIVAISGSAFGLGETIDYSNVPILTEGDGVHVSASALASASPARASTVVYDSLSAGAGYVASPPTTGLLGFEDYVSTLSPSGPPGGSPSTAHDTMALSSLSFGGGQDNGSQGAIVGGVLFFTFFYNDFTTADSFGVYLPTAGAYLWTITISSPGSINVPTEGILALYANNNPNIGAVTSGRWFLSDIGANPLIGHNDTYADGGSYDYGDGDPNLPGPDVDIRPVGYCFTLTIPGPGAWGAFSLAWLASLRRRRR